MYMGFMLNCHNLFQQVFINHGYTVTGIIEILSKWTWTSSSLSSVSVVQSVVISLLNLSSSLKSTFLVINLYHCILDRVIR